MAHDGDDVEYADGQVSTSSLIVRHVGAVPLLMLRSLSVTKRCQRIRNQNESKLIGILFQISLADVDRSLTVDVWSL